MPRPQVTLQALLILLLAVGCFFGGIRLERERQRREDEASLLPIVTAPYFVSSAGTDQSVTQN